MLEAPGSLGSKLLATGPAVRCAYNQQGGRKHHGSDKVESGELTGYAVVLLKRRGRQVGRVAHMLDAGLALMAPGCRRLMPMECRQQQHGQKDGKQQPGRKQSFMSQSVHYGAQNYEDYRNLRPFVMLF